MLSFTPLVHVPTLTVPTNAMDFISLLHCDYHCSHLDQCNHLPSHLLISSSVSLLIHFLSCKQSSLSWNINSWASHTRFCMTCPSLPLQPFPSPHALHSGWAVTCSFLNPKYSPLYCFVHVAIYGRNTSLNTFSCLKTQPSCHLQKALSHPTSLGQSFFSGFSQLSGS